MPQGDAKLVAKNHVFGLKPPARLEQVDNKHPKRVQNGKHRAWIMLRFCHVPPIPRRIEFTEATTIVADLHRMRGIELQLADISYELFESLLNFFRNDLPLERLWVCCINLSPNPRFSRLGNTIPGHYVDDAVNHIKRL